MVSKNPNLLEAFQSATGAASDKGKAIGGPFVPPAAKREAPPPSDGGDAGERPERALPSGLLSFLLALVLFAGGVFVGRWTATPAVAGETDDAVPAGSILPVGRADDTAPSGTQTRPPLARAAGAEPTARTPGAPLTPREKLLIPENRYTAVAVTYGDGADDRQRAQATAGHLAAQGFDAVAVRERGGMALVLVGAAPDLASILGLCERLQETRGVRGELAFADAYPVNIDDFIDR